MKSFLLTLVLCAAALGQSTLPNTPSASKCWQSLFDETGKQVIYTEVPCDSIPAWHTVSVSEVPKNRFSFIGIEPKITTLGWKETFNSKTFWATHSVFATSIVADEYVTLRGESHGCLERGQFGGYHVSYGRLGSVDWGTFGAVTVIDLLLRKAGIPIAPYTDPLVGAAKHGLGVYNWTQTGCL